MNTNKSNKCVINKICPNSVCNNCNRERPTANVKPIVYGKWIVEDDIHCSKCEYQIADFIPNPNDAVALILEHKFCPNCGAKMKNKE